MMSRDLPERWKARILAHVRDCWGDGRTTLSARDFSSGQSVRIRFPDDSVVLFHHAFALRDDERREIAVFTEHCGYHLFPAGDAELEQLQIAP